MRIKITAYYLNASPRLLFSFLNLINRFVIFSIYKIAINNKQHVELLLTVIYIKIVSIKFYFNLYNL